MRNEPTSCNLEQVSKVNILCVWCRLLPIGERLLQVNLQSFTTFRCCVENPSFTTFVYNRRDGWWRHESCLPYKCVCDRRACACCRSMIVDSRTLVGVYCTVLDRCKNASVSTEGVSIGWLNVDGVRHHVVMSTDRMWNNKCTRRGVWRGVREERRGECMCGQWVCMVLARR